MAFQLCRSGGSGWKEPPAAGDSVERERSFVGFGGRVFGVVFADRTPFDPSEKAVAGDAAAILPFDPLGAAVDGAAGVRTATGCGRRLLDPANGHAERAAALHMIEPRAYRPQAITLGADKAYDARDFVNELRSMKVTPHVAQNKSGRSSAIDGRTTTRHAGYAGSQRIRKQIEEAFGWIKTIARQEQTKFRGCDRVGWAFTFAATAYNLTRLPKLTAALA
jgi:hypothetical protein